MFLVSFLSVRLSIIHVHLFGTVFGLGKGQRARSVVGSRLLIGVKGQIYSSFDAQTKCFKLCTERT